ncbi:MAG: hypothetical protein GWN62_20595 [Aliifodinibius sp.]|nr:hypothetical protein [Fodinibius sp.]
MWLRKSSLLMIAFGLVAVVLLGVWISPISAQGPEHEKMMKMVKKIKEMAPAKDYIKAHKDVQKPYNLLGGPININITQESGGVFVALPDKRKLDTRVFGTPEFPRAFGGTPGITGVAPMVREVKNGQFTQMKKHSPFGDKYITMKDANLEIQAVDATATDAATTKDELQFTASWQDKEGNTYAVKCNKLASHGMEFPTFGGVVTNTILHGFTGIGTPLMPSEYTYFAFWGMGAVIKNGEVLDKPRLVHGMLTEYVRTEGYKLGFDKDVTPTRRHFHLMVAPFKPDMENMTFEEAPVKTGFKLPNGMELPFWHVMFENLDIESSRAKG